MRNIGIFWSLQLFLGLFLVNCSSSRNNNSKEGLITGNKTRALINDAGVLLVLQNCNSCHSTQLITQNRLTKVGWKSTIRWMQSTQNLWDLGEDEEPILTYLSKNYAPGATGRRQNLATEDWYTLE